METVADYIFLVGFKITVDGDCSHEIKRQLLLRRKAMTNIDSALKSSDITLPTKEQASFNFMAVGTICSDFGAQEKKICHCFHFFPIYLP